MTQLPLALEPRPSLARADFAVSPANAAALALVSAWGGQPDRGGEPHRRLALAGPEGSGKTHLASLRAAETGAALLGAEALEAARIPDLATRPLVLEDADRSLPGDPAREATLLHLLNAMAEAGRPLLLTGREAPARWPVRLPDLASRLAALPLARLAPPDDALLAALLAKQFRDRGLRPAPDLVPFLVARMERSARAAARLAARLDAAALAEGRSLSRDLARRALGW